MNILIDKIRIKNFRALHNVELSLKPITLLVGANNSGKTSLLRALNTVLGISRTQLNKDDLFIDKDSHQPENSIIIDIHMVPTDNEGKRVDDFIDNKITGVFGGAPNISNNNGQEFFAFRTEYVFENEDTPKNPEFTIIRDWENGILDNPGEFKRIAQVRNAFKMYFIDAQRDLEEEAKLRGSFFGKLASQLESSYSEGDIPALQELIEKLNEEAVGKSDILSHLKMHLEKLNQTTQSSGEGVSISPFPKKIRDLHKGMKVDFQDNGSDTFGMEYHGMGTRSWASMLTVGAYIDWELKSVKDKEDNGEAVEPLFPMLALEEPEAHLHPNAQRTLYSQLKDFKGQKIISTHSPYIAGQADLTELRHFYKAEDKVEISQILFRTENDTQIQSLLQEIEDNSSTSEINRQNRPQIDALKERAKGKINEDEGRKIHKEIMLSRGELLFSKIFVLFEGSTEELALPIFAQYLLDGKYPFELGINLVGVGGKENYKPFLYLSKFLKIPCFILSDGDGNTEQQVRSQIADIFGTENTFDLFVLDNNSDFEKYLLNIGFEVAINKAIDLVENQTDYLDNNYIPELKGEKRKGGSIRIYENAEGKTEAALDCMKENKTKYAEEIAKQIIESVKQDESLIFPQIIKDLFDKINAVLNSSNNPNT